MMGIYIIFHNGTIFLCFSTHVFCATGSHNQAVMFVCNHYWHSSYLLLLCLLIITNKETFTFASIHNDCWYLCNNKTHETSHTKKRKLNINQCSFTLYLHKHSHNIPCIWTNISAFDSDWKRQKADTVLLQNSSFVSVSNVLFSVTFKIMHSTAASIMIFKLVK